MHTNPLPKSPPPVLPHLFSIHHTCLNAAIGAWRLGGIISRTAGATACCGHTPSHHLSQASSTYHTQKDWNNRSRFELSSRSRCLLQRCWHSAPIRSSTTHGLLAMLLSSSDQLISQAGEVGGDPEQSAGRGEGAGSNLEAVLAWCRERAMLEQLTTHLEVSPTHLCQTKILAWLA